MQHLRLILLRDEFLSIQAQDFIEDSEILPRVTMAVSFLSIQAQDFIEESSKQLLKIQNDYS